MVKRTLTALIIALTFISTFASACLDVGCYEQHFITTSPNSMRITKDNDLFGEDFFFEDAIRGITSTVYKSKFRVFRSYELYNSDGFWDATAKFTWSSYLPFTLSFYWHEYYVNDSTGTHLGDIKATLLTVKDAKLYLQNKDGRYVAQATLNKATGELRIAAYENPRIQIASLKRSSGGHEKWSLNLLRPELVDQRLIKLLATIVIDTYPI
ncbi:hypothetical protein [Endozoicomonas ascidiicola]|uniref:hypothetical protein n=1 Tax=Endozoicomonas ascidiicola TaxID=1698521 RepID=UPI00083680FE|nr:hypothetical protein [Endozoicomonas ascidiicola]